MGKYDKNVAPDVSWKNLTRACEIYEPATSKEVKTGDWRTMRPVFDKDKCKQCLLCVPCCSDMSIPMNKEGKREDFDYFFCKGCGICANVCPFDAIKMEKNKA